MSSSIPIYSTAIRVLYHFIQRKHLTYFVLCGERVKDELNYLLRDGVKVEVFIVLAWDRDD
jgi:hypothetical protein